MNKEAVERYIRRWESALWGKAALYLVGVTAMIVVSVILVSTGTRTLLLSAVLLAIFAVLPGLLVKSAIEDAVLLRSIRRSIKEDVA